MRALSSYRTWQDGVRSLSTIINSVLDGNTGDLTLTVSSTSTVVSDSRVGVNSVIYLMPTTANAAAENWYITAITSGSFTVNHASNVLADRTFKYTIEG